MNGSYPEDAVRRRIGPVRQGKGRLLCRKHRQHLPDLRWSGCVRIPGGKSGESAVLCDKEPQLLRRKQTHRRNHVSLLPRQKQGPVLRRKETNRGLHAGGTDHHDCGVPGRGEGNDGKRGDELYVGKDLQ